MAELTPITPERHSKKKWNHTNDYAFAAGDAVITVVGVELSEVLTSMPIGFIEQEAGYQLVAITSLQQGTNLFVAPDGKWLGPYIPVALRAYPFRMVQQKNTENFTLCINEATGLVVESEEGEHAFFDDQGEATEEMKNIITSLSQIEVNRIATQKAVSALADASLITPWALNIKQGEEIVPVNGLFHVDEAALNELDDEDFSTVRKAGGFAVAYAQIFSTNQLAVLEHLGKVQGQILAQQKANSEAENVFGFSLAEDEGPLRFD